MYVLLETRRSVSTLSFQEDIKVCSIAVMLSTSAGKQLCVTLNTVLLLQTASVEHGMRQKRSRGFNGTNPTCHLAGVSWSSA